TDAGMQAFDRATLWYQNLTFDYIIPGKLEIEFPFFAAGAGTVHSITVDGTTYSYTEQAGDGSADVANALVSAVNGAPDPNVDASIGSQAHIVKLVRKLDTGASFNVSASGSGSDTLYHVKTSTICRNIRDQINSTNWAVLGVLLSLSATASGNQITITAQRPGYDGNMIRLYELHKNSNLYFTPSARQLSDGSSDATWRITIEFSAEGATDLQKIWMTFAPKLADSASYQDQEWEATFSNWTIVDTLSKRALKVAGPLSVRIEENDAWVRYTGFWEWAPAQFWSQGRALRAAQTGATATVETHCSATHDVYLGTRLDYNCGIVEARLDGGSPVQLNCYEPAAKARQVRRKVFSNVSAGQHSVEVRLTGTRNSSSQGYYYYFDFLECAVPSDVPDPPTTHTDVAVACDYGTDHTYKLSPQRLVWAIRKLGLIGEIDHYISVFWWNQRKRVGGSFPRVTVTYGGTCPPSAVWVQRYPDGKPVETATGFGNKNSSHCAFAPPFRDYIKKAYEEMVGHMEAAGLTARLQFGEVLWWYFANASGMAFYDAYTTDRFQTQYGRLLHTFLTPNDDPSVNVYVEANFLHQTVKDHVESIRTHVLASHPSAKFELLWPLDVNDPGTRRLNRYINLALEWESKVGSGFETFLIEGFQFAGIDRNLDKVRWMAGYPFEVLSWPRADCRYLMGIFNAGWPWERDYLIARRSCVPLIKIWAYDHLCLFGRGVPLPLEERIFRY
ncbi:MAG: hypothetical protein HY238_20430, partial [Acidobacteria bacterium]|nr:hypothetical protein [Acidobacteriota bacterium]